MFGFIRPVKSELRVREVDRFQQMYCGLCHTIRARYGRFYTFLLSYDMTFFAIVIGCGEEQIPEPCRRRCDASPFCKKACAPEDEALRLSADIGVLLAYLKLQDGVCDERGAKRLGYRLLCRMGRRGYEKARERLPEADEKMRAAIETLQALEQDGCDSMDRAADASAQLLTAAVPPTGDARERILHQMFYHIGRWTYLVDACADVQEDMQEEHYNPVVLRYGLTEPFIEEIKQPLSLTLERSLVDVLTALDLLAPARDGDLIRNIVSLGMPLVTKQVLDGTYRMNGGWGKHGSL